MREVQDHFNRLAKKEGYRSRAAYKLIEIDDRKQILQPGDAVLDCGAWPGSWLQIAATRVGPRGGGVVVGIDLEEIDNRGLAKNVRLLQVDFTKIQPGELLNLIHERSGPSSLWSSGPASRRFDVILSDMAPNTSGDRSIDHFGSIRLCEAVLDRCGELLRPGGNLVLKVFEGEAYAALLKRVAGMFAHVRGFKPKSSRSESSEIYVIAHDHRPAANTPGQAPSAQPRPRSTGWSPGHAPD